MATRQGFTAQITQSADDARRTIINSAPQSLLSHRWFSNMNTTCTIKSAPPRTPEVMTLLSTKSGWLVKRNEQGIWQRRYCCVVPHTFLYYFDSGPSSAGGLGPPGGAGPGGVGNEGAAFGADPAGGFGGNGGGMNSSRHGHGSAAGGNGAAGGSFSASNPSHYATGVGEKTDSGERREDGDYGGGGSSAGPVGIIDLECYSQINRQTIDDRNNGMELTGDAITNPDLRSFFFQGDHPEDCEKWTTAMLSDRHQALRDEREAYRQVCESFPIQLAEMSKLIDEAEQKAKEREVESYQVRSSAEEGRKVIIDLVRECVEKLTSHVANTPNMSANSPFPGTPSRRRNSSSSMSLASAASALSANSTPSPSASASSTVKKKLKDYQVTFLSELDIVLNQSHHRIMGGAPESVSLLVNLLERMVAEFQGAHVKLDKMEGELQKKQYINRSEFVDLEDKLRKQAAKFAQKEKTHSSRIAELESAIQQLQSEKNDLEQMLNTAQMEASIYANNTKTKMKELVEHRRILKKEVIDLRNTVENTKSEVDVLTHQQTVLTQKYKDEKRRRSGLSENYSLLREQLSVQERVWGMMQSSLSSVAGGMPEGGGGASVAAGSLPPEIMMNFPGGGPVDSPATGDVYGKRTHFHPRDVVVKKRGGSVGANSGNDRGALDLDNADNESDGTPSSADSRRSGRVSLADSAEEDQESTSSEGRGGHSSGGKGMDEVDSRQHGPAGGIGPGVAGMHGGGGRAEHRSSGVVPPLHPNRQRSVGGGHRRDNSNDDMSCDVMSEITTDMPFMMSAAAATVRELADQGFEEEGPHDLAGTDDVNGNAIGADVEHADNGDRGSGDNTGDHQNMKESAPIAEVTDSMDTFDAPIVIEDDLQHRSTTRNEISQSNIGESTRGRPRNADKEAQDIDANDDSPTRRQRIEEMRELKAMGKVSNSKVKAKQSAASGGSSSNQKGANVTDTWSSPADGIRFMKQNASLKTIPSVPTTSSSSDDELAAIATSDRSHSGKTRVDSVESKGGTPASNSSDSGDRETPVEVIADGGMCGIIVGNNESDSCNVNSSQIGTTGGGLSLVVECAQDSVQSIACENQAVFAKNNNIEDQVVAGEGENFREKNKNDIRSSSNENGKTQSSEKTPSSGIHKKVSTATSVQSQKGTSETSSRKRSSKRIPSSSSSVKSTKSSRSSKSKRGTGSNVQKTEFDAENALPPPPPPPLMPTSGRREEKKRPPSYGGGYSGSDTQNRHDCSPNADASSVVSNRSMKSDAVSTLSSPSVGGKRMSLSERARLETESPTFSQSVKRASPEPTPQPLITKGSAPGTPRDGFGPQARSPSTGSFFSLLGTRLNDAIDNSVLGVKVSSDGSVQSQGQGGRGGGQAAQNNQPRDSGTPRMNVIKLPQLGGGRNSRNSTPVKQRPDSDKEPKTPLQVRQQQQREKQLAFLKERGLLK